MNFQASGWRVSFLLNTGELDRGEAALFARLDLGSGIRVGRVSSVRSSGGIGVSAEALARSTCYAYVLYTMVLSSRGIGARLRRQIANQ